MAKTVLVVDDDPTQRRLIQAVLDREGYAVVHAESGGEAIDRLTKGGGADVVLDMVGAAYAELNLNALKPGGRWVVIATLTGALAQIDLMRVMLKRIVLTGSTLRSRPADEKARLAAAVEHTVWPWVASGAIRAKVEATFPLEQAADAHLRLGAGDHVGKIVLKL